MKQNNELMNLKTTYQNSHKQQKDKIFFKSGDGLSDLWNNIKQNNIHIIKEKRERKKGRKII